MKTLRLPWVGAAQIQRQPNATKYNFLIFSIKLSGIKPRNTARIKAPPKRTL